ncbi:reverse transcriptase domain-containing protein [Tanacetum coccineum]
MNGWLIKDEDEPLEHKASEKGVDSDLESTASSKPMLKKTTKADPDRASLTNNVNNANGGNGGNGRNNGCTYKGFMACNPKEYDGKGGAISLTRWIEKMENVIDNSGCAENQRVKYAASSFMNKALTWWNTQVQTRGREAAIGMSWTDFKALLVEEFCPSNEMEKLESEFWNHKMVGANHAGYTDRFHKLAKLVSHLVTPKSLRIKRYIVGLAPEIRGCSEQPNQPQSKGVDNRRITLIVIRARANSAVVVSLMEFVLVVLMEMEIKSIFQLRTLLINLQFIYPEPDYSLDFNSPQDLHNLQQQNLCCENCRGPHATIECQPMSQNSHSFGFDQLQTPQFSVNHQPPQPMSMEALQAQEDLMKSIESFLKKFNRISFGKTPKVLLQAWDNFFEVKHAQSEEVQELLSKLVQDVKIIVPIELPNRVMKFIRNMKSACVESDITEAIAAGVGFFTCLNWFSHSLMNGSLEGLCSRSFNFLLPIGIPSMSCTFCLVAFIDPFYSLSSMLPG